jgi:hypothetical protein
MKSITLSTQIKNNLIAIISLVIAIIALSYHTWRNEHTERNRNTRMAAFEMLKELGELQIAINFFHYQHESMMGNLYLSWGHIAFINDLGQLLPAPIPSNVKTLTEVWDNNWGKIRVDETATDKISNEIDNSRESVLNVIRQLK